MADADTYKKIRDWLGTGSVNIFGSPFAGKDTQAAMLAERLDATVIAGGDILRAHSDEAKIKELMLTGELFPTDYYFSIVVPHLSQTKLADKPLVLSSLGRWSGEETTIIKAAAEANHPIKAVIFLHLSEEEMWQRFEASQVSLDRGQRHDDAAHVLEVRIQEFQTKTMPVIEFYRRQGLLTEIDGHGDPAHVHEQIVKALSGIAGTHS